MLFSLILLLLTGMLIYLLLMPIILVINTSGNQYFIQIGKLAIVYLEPHPEKILRIRLRSFFRNFYFYPLIRNTDKKKSRPDNGIKRKPRRRASFKWVFKLISSFKIKKLSVVIDTGDFTTNARWYPVFYFLGKAGGEWHINFEGKNALEIKLANRPIYLLKSFINF